MSAIEQFVSFWGGVASLIALAMSLLAAFFGLYRWGRKRRDAEIQELFLLKESIATRARAATTQGRRSDLFFYYQSLLSHRRFSHVVREVQVATLHIVSVVLLVPLLLNDQNADYYIDKITPPSAWIKSFFPYLTVIYILVTISGNWLLRYQLTMERRRLRAASSGLTDELRSYLAETEG